MNEQQTLQNIWAMPDKTVIDMMTKKTHHSPSTVSINDSTDDDSDLESIDSRYGPFVAVPKEFRPSLKSNMKTEYPQMSLNESKQVLSDHYPVSASKPTAKKRVPAKPPFFTNSKPSFLVNPKPPLLLNPKPPLLPNPKPSLLPYPRPPLLPNPESKPASMECKRISTQNEISGFKKNVNHSKNIKHLEFSHNCRQFANDTTTAPKNAFVRKNSGVNGKAPIQPPKKITNDSFQKRNEILSMKEPKHENAKNLIKYECVKNQEDRTLKLNFEMPSFSNRRHHKEREIIKKANKNFLGDRERELGKKAHTFLYEKSTIKWIGPLNSEEEESNTEVKTERDNGKLESRVSSQGNVMKWDNSLKREKLKNYTKDEIERDVNKGTIMWHLNIKDSSSDSEGKIEWTVIQEKKTIISANKIASKDNIHKLTNNRHLPTMSCTQNESDKPRKHQRRKHLNKNVNHYKNDHRKNTPNPNCKDPANLVYKNDLPLNNNFKCDEIRNSNTQNKVSPDAETFNQQCRINEQSSDNSKINSNLSNDKPQVTINSNESKTIDDGESNSYPEKIDNITLKRIEEQTESMLHYGRELSDLIIGSYSALSMFISMFNEWKRSRLELINHFQHLEKNLKESSKKFTKYNDMLDMAKTGATLAAAVPLPHISIAARGISVLTSLFSAFLRSSEKSKAEVEESNDISIAATRDTNASTDLYMYGLQCGQNFEDAAKLIEEFHSNVADPVIFDKDSPEMATFIRGVLEYRPRHRIFYKKLHRCFQELIRDCSSEFGKRFCEPFFLNSPQTIDVVEFLTWRFRHEDFNGESVRFELQQIECLIQGKETSIKELTVRIQTCLGILQDELKFIEGCVKDFNFFDTPTKF